MLGIDSNDLTWTPSVYYAESMVKCAIETAWVCLLAYQAWNPSFAGATVVPKRGQANTEGEIVQITKPLKDVGGAALPEFYAETVKVVPQRHIVWYAYPKDGDAFRNFVDFGLSEASSGVKFNIYYYEQTRLTGELLAKQRVEYQALMQRLTAAFKAYCEKTGNAV